MYFIKIDYECCDGCKKCYYMCPRMVFEMKDGKAHLYNAANCAGCISCVEVCPKECVSVSQI